MARISPPSHAETTVICHEPSVSRESVAAAKLQDPVDASLNIWWLPFAQDRRTNAMHRCLPVKRRELVEECDPIWHPEIIQQLD